MSIDFDYTLINLVLLIVFICAGINVAKGTRKFPGVLTCILTFSIVLGVRFGRGLDYVHYIHVFNYDLEPTQVAFTYFNKFLKLFSVSHFAIFFFYALFFITAGLQLVKKFRELDKYLFPFFLIAFICYVEFVIRQSFSFSFVFLYIIQLYQYTSKKKGKYLVFASVCVILAYSIHSANLIEIFFITIIYALSRFNFSWKMLVFFYLFSKYFIANMFDFSWLNRIVNFMPNLDSKFVVYTDNANQWFSESAIESKYARNYFISILETFANCLLIVLTKKALSRASSLNLQIMQNLELMIVLFYCFVFGSCFLQMFHNIELFRRLFNPLYYFWCFPLSFVLSYKSTLLNKRERLGLIPILIFYIYEYFRYLFMRNGETLFLWDM